MLGQPPSCTTPPSRPKPLSNGHSKLPLPLTPLLPQGKWWCPHNEPHLAAPEAPHFQLHPHPLPLVPLCLLCCSCRSLMGIMQAQAHPLLLARELDGEQLHPNHHGRRWCLDHWQDSGPAHRPWGRGRGPASHSSSHLGVTFLQSCSKLGVEAGAKLPGRFLALQALPLGAAHVKKGSLPIRGVCLHFRARWRVESKHQYFARP